MFDGYSEKTSTKDCAHMRRSDSTIGVTVHFASSMALQPIRKSSSLTSITNIDALPCCLRDRSKQGVRSTRHEETPTSSLCKPH